MGEGLGRHQGSGRLASDELRGNRKELLGRTAGLVEPGLRSRSSHWGLGSGKRNYNRTFPAGSPVCLPWVNDNPSTLGLTWVPGTTSHSPKHPPRTATGFPANQKVGVVEGTVPGPLEGRVRATQAQGPAKESGAPSNALGLCKGFVFPLKPSQGGSQHGWKRWLQDGRPSLLIPHVTSVPFKAAGVGEAVRTRSFGAD